MRTINKGIVKNEENSTKKALDSNQMKSFYSNLFQKNDKDEEIKKNNEDIEHVNIKLLLITFN